MNATNYQRLALTTFKPGQAARRSGQFAVLDHAGNPTGAEITMVRGKTFPATAEKGGMYRLVDSTKHVGDVDDSSKELTNG